MITLHTLLISAGLGFVWLILLFLFCFCGVHGIRLAKYGWTYQRQKEKSPPPKPPEAPKEERAPTQTQEPVYYIVEKKRTRQKAKYGEPKEIRFK